jgi:hypothetical protein
MTNRQETLDHTSAIVIKTTLNIPGVLPGKIATKKPMIASGTIQYPITLIA